MKAAAVSISKRPGMLGPSINTRTEKSGDDSVPAADIPIDGIMLDRAELNELLADEHAHDAIYNHRGCMIEPMFPQLAGYTLRDKFENARVTLWLGLEDEDSKIELRGCKLNRVTLTPMPGGLTAMFVQVQCHPDGEDMAALFAHMDRRCAVSLNMGAVLEKKTKVQPELPMGAEPVSANALA